MIGASAKQEVLVSYLTLLSQSQVGVFNLFERYGRILAYHQPSLRVNPFGAQRPADVNIRYHVPTSLALARR